MGLRPARCYRKLDRPYTRTAKRSAEKAYVRGVPDPRIRLFDMGNPKGKYTYEIDLITKQPVQIRHNALESVRIFVNKKLDTQIGKENYWLKIRVYPHHVLRENALLTGAGADRLQTGMKHAFGRPIGKAARVKRGATILSVRVKDKTSLGKAKAIIKAVTPKLPLKYKTEVVKLAARPSSQAA